MKIGCHLSASGGYLAMAQTAVSIGANVFQFFTRNPRGGAAKPIDPNDVAAFLEYAAANEGSRTAEKTVTAARMHTMNLVFLFISAPP